MADWAGGSRAAARLSDLLTTSENQSPDILVAPSGAAAVGVGRVSGGPAEGASIAREQRVLCAFEGRLDDAGELRRQLDLEAGDNPAKLLARAYARWGEDLLPRLRGEFAFVLWDDLRRRVLGARDPFGVRPLHQVATREETAIASDADQFLAARLIDGSPDDTRVVEFLTRRFGSVERSYFRDLRRIPGGHALVGTAEGARTFDYRVLPDRVQAFASTQECHETFRGVFHEAVRRRLRSDRPVVAELSGGRDSSAIVCVADRLLRDEPGLTPGAIAAFAAHPGLACDESSYVDVVARHVSMPISRWDGTMASALEFEEPLLAAPGNRMTASGGTDGYVEIARERGSSVVLTGLGGDHIGQPLGGALDQLAEGRWLAGARHAFPGGMPLRDRARTLVRIVDAFSPAWFPRIYPRLRRHPPLPDWLTPLARGAMTAIPGTAGGRTAFASHGQRIRWDYLNQAVLGVSLDMRQRHAASRGLEVRLPFLDWDLVALTLSIPHQHWPPSGRLVRMHPEALRVDLPPEIAARQSKADFTPALIHRVTIQLPALTELFHGRPWAAERFVNPGEARRLLARFRDAPSSRNLESAHHIWAIASLEAWLRAVLRYRTGLVGHGRDTRHERIY